MQDPAANPFFLFNQEQHHLFPATKSLWQVLKASGVGDEERGRPCSSFDRAPGTWVPPYDVHGLEGLRDLNTHHSISLDRCAGACVGQGHENEKIYDILDPLSPDDSWQAILGEVAEDVVEKNCGFVETVREDPSKPDSPVGAVYTIPLRYIQVQVEDHAGNYHYVVNTEGGTQRKFARFGDLKRMRALFQQEEGMTELIRFRVPTSRSSWFGYPTWFSAIPWIELSAMATQRKFDFYQNRGVAEFLLFLLSDGNIPDPTWAAIQSVFSKFAGSGNAYKSGVFQLPTATKVEDVKIATDLSKDSAEFATTMQEIDAHIVSAHGIPPLLASIQVPGKLGGANEGPNAVRMYQILRVDALQLMISRTLATTLANDKHSPGLGLTVEMFLPRGLKNAQRGVAGAQLALKALSEEAAKPKEQQNPAVMQNAVDEMNRRDYSTGFVTVLDRMNLGFSMDTSSQMRQDETQAAAQGRDPKKGLIKD